MIVVFDTETTGLPLWNEPSEHPGQPHIVQISAMLAGDALRDPVVIDWLVKPDGWLIPVEATKIHGITHERALRDGRPAEHVLAAVFSMLTTADLIVGHNVSFDLRMMRIACMRHKLGDPDKLNAVETFCTMGKSTAICKLPPTEKMMRAGRRTFKSPTLAEAYEFFFKKKLVGAHNSLNDMRACREIYLELQRRAA